MSIVYQLYFEKKTKFRERVVVGVARALSHPHHRTQVEEGEAEGAVSTEAAVVAQCPAPVDLEEASEAMGGVVSQGEDGNWPDVAVERVVGAVEGVVGDWEVARASEAVGGE